MLARQEAVIASAITPDEKLRRVVYDFVHATLFDYSRFLVILADRAGLGADSAAPERLTLIRDFVRHFRAIVEEGVAAGVFSPVDPGVAALTIIQGIIGVARWYRPEGRLSPAEICEQVTELLVAAVRRADAAP